jgi:hypothetical protein
MLRRLFICAIGLMLAACANQTPPATATLALPGSTNTPPAPATLVIVTRSAAQEARDSIVIPLPGTLVASETEDPRADVPFTTISIVRLHQGVADQLVIKGDGTFLYNNVPGVLSPQQITTINQAIKEINFFGIEATFISMVPQNDVYEYALTIERGEDVRTVVSQDKFTPAPYMAFLSDLWNTRDALGAIPTSLPPQVITEEP